jgi:hypothetical protein
VSFMVVSYYKKYEFFVSKRKKKDNRTELSSTYRKTVI